MTESSRGHVTPDLPPEVETPDLPGQAPTPGGPGSGSGRKPRKRQPAPADDPRAPSRAARDERAA